VGNQRQPGIYVEIFIRKSVDEIWSLTQEPHLHQRWDLRFDQIQYLPRASSADPQRFLYETRIGFGLSIKGTGESVGQRELESGENISSLKFASDDTKSLIREGSGYWRYIPVENGIRFLTWYDYQVRFGMLGRIVDRLAFRPLIGWATAWSFDRLRLWAESGQSPELSMSLSMVHAIARITIAFIWIWHGLVPKLLYRQIDERIMLSQAGIPLSLLPWIGSAEIFFGILVLATWRQRTSLMVNALLMLFATVVVAIKSPHYLIAAFDPVTLNLSIISLSIMGWLSSRRLPTASRCLRRPAGVQS
jgi:uncharacterized membrane protein YphA (DoxX/SURF4 family)